jgi:hypothetical protein
MDFWRSEAYTKFFEYLESTGGFYYEVNYRRMLSVNVSLTVHRDGEMHPFIASPQHYSHAKTNCISSRI